MKSSFLKMPQLSWANQYRIIGLILVVLTIFIMSCSVEPVPIQYGSDQCHFCKMTIVDQQHAAQYVTSKGKAFKFDAIECMMKELNIKDEGQIRFVLVTDYHTPKKLIDAKSAHYLVSTKIPSPMGAYLSGFESQEIRDWTLDENGGLTYNWEELRQKFSK